MSVRGAEIRRLSALAELWSHLQILLDEPLGLCSLLCVVVLFGIGQLALAHLACK